MQKNRRHLILLCILLLTISGNAQTDYKWYKEKLNRGLVAVPRTNACTGFLVSWRLLGSDDSYTTFDVLRDGNTIASNLNTISSYYDAAGRKGDTYQVVTKQHGEPVDTTVSAKPWTDVFYQLHMDRPASGTRFGYSYEYYPNDCECADVDGDGEYEIICKWQSNMAADNAQFGYTSSTIIDCYKLDGTKLWRVDLGCNIRSGAHYTPYLVYDFDGDGKAELICKTAPGSIDGQNKYVSEAATEANIKSTDNSKDYTYSTGFVVNGPEYLTVFNGETGAAIHTIYYNPNRGCTVGGDAELSTLWGDEYGNRADRFLACVAFLDGPNSAPSAVMCRGYYTRAYLWAVDFDGKELKTHWRHASIAKSIYMVTDSTGKITTKTCNKATYSDADCFTAYGQGNHNLSVADVDNDGCDEIIYGSATIDNNGYLLYTTGLAHGDAMHVADIMPDRPGLEVFDVHEDPPYGFDIHDAATGEIIMHRTLSGDTGRGIAADVNPNSRGYEFWSFGDTNMYGADQSVVGTSMSYNFRIYWDGDLQDELLSDIGNHNQPFLEKYNYGRVMVGGVNVYATGYSTTCNGTKGSPCLSADLFGDWREEMIFYNGEDDCTLNIYSTAESTKYRFPTLMHDHTYRMGVAWQNVGYNQPPHLGYYLPDSVYTHISYLDPSTKTQSINIGEEMKSVTIHYSMCTGLSLLKTILPNGTSKTIIAPSGITLKTDPVLYEYTISGKPTEAGLYQFIVRTTGDCSGIQKYDTIKVTVVDPTGIEYGDIHNLKQDKTYNLQGEIMNTTSFDNLSKGIYIQNKKKYIKNK
jgi:rhamnogalacturonan endolyase